MAARDHEALRAKMVASQIEARGIHDRAVLDAMRQVPREVFVEPEFVELAYEDAPQPIGAGQTISQPYIVALMVEAAKLSATSRVLEIGAGSGYAAAVMSRIASEVYAIERHRSLADETSALLTGLDYDNVHIVCGDGTLGLAAHAPYDAIVVSAGGPSVPAPLVEQLAIGGRLVIPVGATLAEQRLVRITKESATEHTREDLGAVRFVPLIGAEGWASEAAVAPAPVERIGDAREALLGEATHGTSEFSMLRGRSTREHGSTHRLPDRYPFGS